MALPEDLRLCLELLSCKTWESQKTLKLLGSAKFEVCWASIGWNDKEAMPKHLEDMKNMPQASGAMCCNSTNHRGFGCPVPFKTGMSQQRHLRLFRKSAEGSDGWSLDSSPKDL